MKERVAAQLELDPHHIEADATFVELGADSLLLAKVVQDVQDTYGVGLGISQLFEELDTFEALSTHLDQLLPAHWSPAAATVEEPPAGAQADSPAAHLQELSPRPPALPSASSPAPADRRNLPEHADALTQILSYQLDIMARQLDILAHSAPPQATPRRQFRETVAASTASPSPAPRSPEAASSARQLKPEQQRHLDMLIARYVERTAASRERAKTHRARRADTRMRLVRPETKELAYPLVGARADGAHFWDIDGNEYIDIAMGVGALLCGHNPPFVARAVSEQLERAIQTGPISELADEVAALACEMTGMERAFFAVTGTGAVRGALRLAQTVTGRSKFVMFSGSYHGQDDRTLALPDIHGDPLHSVPMTPGVSPRAVEDVIILLYDNPKSLETIAAHAHELAAVLVEPIQSRNPGVRPGAFLADLRRLTADLNVPLIFDEIITGFRIHPGGAQRWFGVDADIAVYGKCIGGGMPVSIVAGKAAYLDRVDGGQWINEEGSTPRPETTYIGSTFEMHPLAMAATRAMLRHLKEEGPTLQQRLNERATYLADALNALFADEQVPIRVLQFASLFRFAWKGNASYAFQPLEMEVFHLHLIEKGIYIWEGRTCFLSTVHSAADIERIIEAVRETLAEMRAGGFLPSASRHASSGSARGEEQAPGLRGHLKSPLSEEQRVLWSLERLGDADSPSWCVGESLLLRGSFRLAACRQAVQVIVDRHEALRTIFSEDGEAQEILPALKVETELIDLTHLTGAARAESVTDRLKREMARPFDLQRGPLVRTYVFKLAEDLHQFALITHHIVTDGWSIGILLEELAAVYSAECRGGAVALEPPPPYRDFTRRQAEQRGSEVSAAHEAYWLGQFGEWPAASMLPTDRPRPARLRHHGDRYSARLDA
ncbi:MAG TPA: aminotransferase class III-fold pyridoxal phosphate-dependent enzyme, partial [Pyrinomonadaceae bacterium]